MDNQIESSIATLWVKNTFIGWIVGFVIVVILALLFENIGLGTTNVFIGLGMGLSVGFFQWKAFQNLIGISKKWIWFSMVGMALPFIISEIAPIVWSNFSLPYSLQLNVSIGGLLVGLMQFQILRIKTKKAIWWVFACFIGWILATFFSTISDFNIIPKSMGLFSALITLFLMLMGGVVLGFVQSRFLIKMLNKNV